MSIDFTTNDSKYLFSTASAILNDKKPLSSMNRVNWSTVFRLSNYHKIANIMYYAILGSNEKMTNEVRKSFYIAFNEALLSHDRVSKAQAALFWKLDSENVETVVFRGADFNELYPFKEMGLADSLEIYVHDIEKTKLDSIMQELDFMPSPIKSGDCVVYSRSPKCEVRVYFKNPFYDATMKKYYNDTFLGLAFKEGYNSIRGFDVNNYYIFLVSMIANNYALKNAKVRQVLDLWIFHRTYQEDFDWDYILLELDRLNIGDMARRILELSFIWFDGTVPKNSEDIDVYDTMENYILSRGDIGFRESCELFPIVKELNKLILEEQARIEKENYKKFLYPDQEYMQGLYPRLASNRIGLQVAYLLRRIRLLTGAGDKSYKNDEVQSFYEPRSEYPNNYYETGEDTELSETRSAPLVVADDVKVMDDVLPANIGNKSAGLPPVFGRGKNSSGVGYISEAQLINMANKDNNANKSDSLAKPIKKGKAKSKKSIASKDSTRTKSTAVEENKKNTKKNTGNNTSKKPSKGTSKKNTSKS